MSVGTEGVATVLKLQEMCAAKYHEPGGVRRKCGVRIRNSCIFVVCQHIFDVLPAQPNSYPGSRDVSHPVCV